MKRISRREHLTAVKGTLEGLAAMAGVPPPEFKTRIPEQRAPRSPSVGITEAQVNGDIREMQRYKPGARLYRNNIGTVELPGGQMLRYGVGPHPGASDWIGWRTMTITPEMIGQTVAVFCAVESKRPGNGPTPDQQKFIDTVRAAGGRAGVAHSANEAEEILDGRA